MTSPEPKNTNGTCSDELPFSGIGNLENYQMPPFFHLPINGHEFPDGLPFGNFTLLWKMAQSWMMSKLHLSDDVKTAPLKNGSFPVPLEMTKG